MSFEGGDYFNASLVDFQNARPNDAGETEAIWAVQGSKLMPKSKHSSNEKTKYGRRKVRQAKVSTTYISDQFSLYIGIFAFVLPGFDLSRPWVNPFI